MIGGMFDSGAMPALERVVQFTSARHRVLAHNVANLSTPYFKPRDLAPEAFRESLREAIDQRRHTAHGVGPLRGVQELGSLGAETGQELNEGLLYHDQNNRDLERTMQRLAENTLVHNASIEMLRNQFSMLQMAIRQRI